MARHEVLIHENTGATKESAPYLGIYIAKETVAMAAFAAVVDAKAAAEYDRMSKFYLNLWDPKTRFFRPKNSEGAFVEPFDPIICGGKGARNYYTENNAWTYIWDVQHPRRRSAGSLLTERQFRMPLSLQAKSSDWTCPTVREDHIPFIDGKTFWEGRQDIGCTLELCGRCADRILVECRIVSRASRIQGI